MAEKAEDGGRVEADRLRKLERGRSSKRWPSNIAYTVGGGEGNRERTMGTEGERPKGTVTGERQRTAHLLCQFRLVQGYGFPLHSCVFYGYGEVFRTFFVRLNPLAKGRIVGLREKGEKR